jgi:hypothetical protein
MSSQSEFLRVQAFSIATIADYLQLDEPGRSSSWLERFRWAERCIKALRSSEVSSAAAAFCV